MSREVTVVTPENIPLTLELAGLSTRFAALLVDTLVQLLLLSVVVLVFVALGVSTAAFDSAVSRELTGWIIAAGILLVFLIFFGYFILFETIWNGQTPGKKAVGIRVVRDGGYPINFFAATARNLVRIADWFPSNYGIGALAVFFHPQYKRLGDLAGGTLVIKERAAKEFAFGMATAAATAAGGGSPPPLPSDVRHPADVLTAEEAGLLRRFALRRWEMRPDDAERLAYRLVVPLVSRLNLTFTPGVPPRYADLVSALIAAVDAREEDRARE